MRRYAALAIGTTLALLSALPGQATAQDAALLLGEREKTLLIVVHGDSVVARRGPGLIVPRPSGWWRVGVDWPSIQYPELHDRLYPQWRADSIRNDSLMRWQSEHPETMPETPVKAPDSDPAPDSLREPTTNMQGEELGHNACFGHIVWAVPLGTLPVLPDNDCLDGADLAGEYSFTFVSPVVLTMYAGITTDLSYNFTRGTIVATLDSAARHPLVSIAARNWDEGEPRPVPALGLTPDDPAWWREAVRCNVEYNRGIRADDEGDSTSFDYQGTWIIRTPGRWRYERYYANTSYAGRGMESSCFLGMPVPARLTGWDRLTVPMSAVRKRVPKAFDAFTSPDGAIAVVLDSTSTRVFRIEKGALGRELDIVAPDPNWIRGVDMTTMSQWATGAAAGRWEKEWAAVLPEVVLVRKGKR